MLPLADHKQKQPPVYLTATSGETHQGPRKEEQGVVVLFCVFHRRPVVLRFPSPPNNDNKYEAVKRFLRSSL